MPYIFDRGSSQHRMYRLAGFTLFAIGLILAWLLLPEFQVSRLGRTAAMAVAILGLNLVVGYSGLLALCQSAFIAIGAFVTATLIMDHGWDYWMTIPISMLAAFIVGLILGVPALRIKGLYLAMATVAFAAAFPSLTKLEFTFGSDLTIADRTGGANGREITSAGNGLGEKLEPTWFPFFENEPSRYRFIPIALLAVLSFWLVGNLVKSRPGRAVISIRDNEIGAAVSGVELRRFKVINFGISAALGGLAGVMWAMNTGFVAEQDYTFVLMVDLLVGLVVGGVATVSGAAIGAVIVVFGRWLVQTYFNYSSAAVLWIFLGVAIAILLVRRFPGAAQKIGAFLAVSVVTMGLGLWLFSLDNPTVPGWILLLVMMGALTWLVMTTLPADDVQGKGIAGALLVLATVVLGWQWFHAGDNEVGVNGMYQLNGDGPLSQAVFGIVLIVVVFIAPQGIVGAWRKVWSRVVQIRPVPPELPADIESISAMMTNETEAHA